MNEVEALDPRRRELLEQKLGTLLSWTVPELVRTVGPFDLKPYEDFDARLRSIIGACASQLNAYSDTDVDRVLQSSPGDRGDLNASWTSYLSGDIRRLRKSEPSYYAGGFGHPRTRADVAYWSKMAHFSVNEIVCLSVGLEPSETLFHFLHPNTIRDPKNLLPAFAYLGGRQEQITRKFGNDHEDRIVRPASFLEWVDAVHIEVDEAFLSALRRTCGQAARGTAQSTAPEPDKREIDKIAQLFTFMAIDQLGYEPSAARSPIPGEIAKLARQVGISISEDTVRKYLKRGAKFLPKDREPE